MSETKFVTSEFKIGMRVTTKQLGPPIVGTIVAVIVPEMLTYFNSPFRELFGGNRVEGRWEDIYPLWEEKAVVGIVYDQPVPSLNIDEIKEKYHCNDREAAVLQEYVISKHLRDFFPEDDLELF